MFASAIGAAYEVPLWPNEFRYQETVKGGQHENAIDAVVFAIANAFNVVSAMPNAGVCQEDTDAICLEICRSIVHRRLVYLSTPGRPESENLIEDRRADKEAPPRSAHSDNAEVIQIEDEDEADAASPAV